MKTILQVEDDPNDVLLFGRALKKAGVAHPVQIAKSGQEAIDYLQGSGKFADRSAFPLPGLVLLDLKLPHVMGLEVLRWIRQQPGSSPIVIVMTSSTIHEDIAAAYALGANAFLTKPAEIGELVEMVGAIRDFWLTHNTPPPPPESPVAAVARHAQASLDQFWRDRPAAAAAPSNPASPRPNRVSI